MVTSNWAQDSWSSALLPHHQPIRRKSHTLQPSLQILPLKLPPSTPNQQGFLWFWAPTTILLAWPYNKPFSAPNSSVMLCLASLCIGHMNLLLNFSNTLVTIAVTLVVQAGAQLHSTGAFGWMIRRKNKESWDLKLLVDNLTTKKGRDKRKQEASIFFFFVFWTKDCLWVLWQWSLLPFLPMPGSFLDVHSVLTCWVAFSSCLLSKESVHCYRQWRFLKKQCHYKPVKTELEVNRWKCCHSTFVRVLILIVEASWIDF